MAAKKKSKANMNDTSKASIKSGQQRVEALKLRIAGLSYRKIAKEVGVSVGMAHRYVTEALEEIRHDISEKADELRTLELERMDSMLAAIWPLIIEAQGEDGPNLAAVDRILRIMERRSKLVGLDLLHDADERDDDAVPVQVIIKGKDAS